MPLTHVTHGPECRGTSHPLGRCDKCGRRIFFYHCNHGSRVVFNEGTWEKHRCPRRVPSREELERLEISYWQI